MGSNFFRIYSTNTLKIGLVTAPNNCRYLDYYLITSAGFYVAYKLFAYFVFFKIASSGLFLKRSLYAIKFKKNLEI